MKSEAWSSCCRTTAVTFEAIVFFSCKLKHRCARHVRNSVQNHRRNTSPVYNYNANGECTRSPPFAAVTHFSGRSYGKEIVFRGFVFSDLEQHSRGATRFLCNQMRLGFGGLPHALPPNRLLRCANKSCTLVDGCGYNAVISPVPLIPLAPSNATTQAVRRTTHYFIAHRTNFYGVYSSYPHRVGGVWWDATLAWMKQTLRPA